MLPAPSPGSAQTVPAAPRIHDRQRGLLSDAQEILIGGDEELGPTCQRRGQHPGVIRIPQRWIGGGWPVERRSCRRGVGPQLWRSRAACVEPDRSALKADVWPGAETGG